MSKDDQFSKDRIASLNEKSLKSKILSEIRAERASRTPEETKELSLQWQEENRAAIDSSNKWVEEYGLPLAEYRMF